MEEICRKMGISDATFYKWRQKYAGVGPSELLRREGYLDNVKRVYRLYRLEILWLRRR